MNEPVGIASYGAYIPRTRLAREQILEHIGWLDPSLAALAKGEKAVCNWDEDSLTMAVEGARDCLTGRNKRTVGAIYLASTTLPFSDRSNAGIVGTALNLPPALISVDVMSTQRAGTTALVTALDAVRGGRENVLVLATDQREAKAASAAEMIFGDGAAALLVSRTDLIAEFAGSFSLTYDFVGHYRWHQHRFDYGWEERWVRQEGYRRILPEAIRGLLDRVMWRPEDVEHVVFPCPYARDRVQIAELVGVRPEALATDLHAECGETGAAHPLLMLVAVLERAKPGERIVVAGFGQGADAIALSVTDRISALPRRAGVSGSLSVKRPLSYMKYLRFRNLLTTETGIRSEAAVQTALTTLWRKRKMILGLVGGKCRVCRTAQFPSAQVCVNPQCGAVDSQDEYEFADRDATVKSFTGDMLAASADPPSIYGLIQFDGGGRLMADFTDCSLGQVEVGMPVRMSFRRHAVDTARGFVGYFWKGVPLRGSHGQGSAPTMT